MPNDQMDADKTDTSLFSGDDRPVSEGFQMARFMIHWCAPDPTSQEYTEAIVNYIKGGKSMDEFAGFAVLARQIHPQTGGGVLLVEAAAQLAGAVAHHAVGGDGQGMLVLHEARFKRPVEPPAEVELSVELDRSMGSIHRFEFEARVAGTVVALGAVAVSLPGSESSSESGS